MDSQQLAQFQLTLRASTEVALKFSDLLVKEKKHLTSTSRDAINALLQDKQHLINELSKHQETILDFCSKAKIEPSYSAMRAMLFRIDADNAESILADWTLLKNALIKNQALNKTNEAILNELMRRNQIKQSIVNGLGRKSDTYSSSGQKSTHTETGWVEQV